MLRRDSLSFRYCLVKRLEIFAKHILMKNTSNHSADQMFLVPMVIARVVLSSCLSFARFTKG